MSSKTSQNNSLREWILSTAAAGHSIEQIIQMMLRAGYQPRQARQLVAKILDRPAVAMDLVTDQRNGRRTQHPKPPFQTVDGKRVDISVSVDSPVIRVLEGFMGEDECEQLIELARPRLDRSRTVNKLGDDQVDKARTSQGMFFQVGEAPLIERIEQRIATLVDMPARYGEGLQVLHYLPGQQYEPHYDWFNPERGQHPDLPQHPARRRRHPLPQGRRDHHRTARVGRVFRLRGRRHRVAARRAAGRRRREVDRHQVDTRAAIRCLTSPSRPG
jgi:prolyl 4-hydroxylase